MMKRINVPKGYSPCFYYLDLAIGPYSRCGASLALRGGRSVALEQFPGGSELEREEGIVLVRGTDDNTSGIDLDEVIRLDIPGILVTLPVNKRLQRTGSDINGGFTAEDSMVELDAGSMRVASVVRKGELIEIAVAFHADSSEMYPVSALSYGLVSENGKVLEGRGSFNTEDLGQQVLTFDAPTTTSNLVLDIRAVQFAVPGEWSIDLRKN